VQTPENKQSGQTYTAWEFSENNVKTFTLLVFTKNDSAAVAIFYGNCYNKHWFESIFSLVLRQRKESYGLLTD
jgi:hypothetical protein